MGEGVLLRSQLDRNRLPVDVSKVAIFDDGEEQVLVRLVIPLRRHLECQIAVGEGMLRADDQQRTSRGC